MYVLKINICTFGIFKRKHANQEGIPKKNKNEKRVRARNQDKKKIHFNAQTIGPRSHSSRQPT